MVGGGRATPARRMFLRGRVWTEGEDGDGEPLVSVPVDTAVLAEAAETVPCEV